MQQVSRHQFCWIQLRKGNHTIGNKIVCDMVVSCWWSTAVQPRHCVFSPGNQLRQPPWWRHQMETFSALLALYAENSPVPVNSTHKGQWRGPLMFFYLRPNKRLIKQPWGWWFETPSWSLWHQCNDRGDDHPEPIIGDIICHVTRPNISITDLWSGKRMNWGLNSSLIMGWV